MTSPPLRVLVAALGCVLRGDDGFGPALLARVRSGLPAGTTAMDFGTQGLALVQTLYDRFDVLVLFDACVRGRAAGTVSVLAPEVPSTPQESIPHTPLADAHVAHAAQVLMLARALGVLPPTVWLIGCEPQSTDDHRLGLSPPVGRALEAAAQETFALLRALRAEDDVERPRNR